MSILELAAGMALDRLLGEPRRFHPLVGFGRWAQWLEAQVRRLSAAARPPEGGAPSPGEDVAQRQEGSQVSAGRAAGLMAWALAVLPWVGLALALGSLHPAAGWATDVVLLYFALGARSLTEHAEAVAAPLERGDLETARTRVGWMVSRDTATLDPAGVAKAGTESVLENGNDAVFGALFWFCVAGGAGALLFRLANTLDAMWGYRTPRYLHFGWAAARIDDLLNWLPARLTALTYALLGRTRDAWRCWRTQAGRWESPNAGPVMAAGAGALAVRLGGAAIYHGREEERPPLGCGAPPDAASVRGAAKLVERGMLLWLTIAALAAAITWLASTVHA